MRKEGIEAVEKEGVFTVDTDGEYVTPLVNNKECAFVTFDNNDIAKCSIEQAHKEGKTDFKKPISCHLYPVRLSQLKDHVAVNYSRWHICKPACECGSKLNVKVYRFLKDALIRKFGEDWYKELDEIDKLLYKIKLSENKSS